MIIEALALDLDGTLTNSKKEITPRTKKAVSAAMAKGINIILASGRPILGIAPIAKELGLYENGGYILAYNGGQIIDCKRNKVIFENSLPAKYNADIFKIAEEFGVHALTYDPKGVAALSDTAEFVIKEAYNNAIPISVYGTLEKISTIPSVKLMVVGEPEKIAPVLAFLKKKFDDEISVFLSEPYFIEITAPGVEKSSSLTWLIEHLGVDRAHLCCIGDGLNDISMLKFAGCAVAMANAYDEVKSVADYVTESNNADGVAVFLEKMVFKNG